MRLLFKPVTFPFVFGWMWYQMAKGTEGRMMAAAGSVFAFGAAVYLTLKGERPEREFEIGGQER